MKLLRSPDKIAGLLSLLAALLVLAIWFILLFVAPIENMPVTESAMSALNYFFSNENPSRLWFVWLAILPLACTILGVAYLFNFARSKSAATVLLALSAGLGIAAFIFTNWALAFFVSLPSYWGYRCVYRA